MVRRLLAVGVVLGALVTVAVAGASDNGRAGLYAGIGNGDCFGANDFSQPRGFLNFHLAADGAMTVNVHVRDAVPNATYVVFQRCIDFIGTLTTNSRGVGNGTFTFSPFLTSVDMATVDANNQIIDAIHSAPITP
jgi:hypothetical protein